MVEELFGIVRERSAAFMEGGMKIYSRDTNRWIDWDSVRELWLGGLDTRDIARQLWIHESVIYNNLDRIKVPAPGLARAS